MGAPADALLIIHGGGPTAVMNASLFGAVDEARRSPRVGRVLGARFGVAGLAGGDFVDLGSVPEGDLALLPSSPSSAIGTGRDAIDGAGYEELARALDRNGIRWVLMNGGNGTMDACGRLCAAVGRSGVDARVIGIPKTMDNDLALTDHAPGYGSAARFAAQAVSEIRCDVRGLPIHISVVELMGRSSGWVAAASALAADAGFGPDLIYLPERAFDEGSFLDDVQRLIDASGSGVVVASEGLRDVAGRPVVDPVMTVGRATYFGDVSAHLARLITRELGYKARAEKPGLVGRASIAYQSGVDRDEAILAGRAAVRAALAGESGKMVGFERTAGAYGIRLTLLPLEQVMLEERHVPDAFINEQGNGVTEAFLTWCRPLIGDPLPRFASFV